MLSFLKGKNKKSTDKEKKKKEKNSFDLAIDEINNNYIKDNEGYYKQILRIDPVNCDFLEERELEILTGKLSTILNKFKRFGIYIQRENLNLENYKERQKKISMKQESAQIQKKQESLINYVKQQGISVSSTKRFYLVTESKNYELLNKDIDSIANLISEIGHGAKKLSKKEIMEIIYTRLNPRQSKSQPIQPEWEIEDLYPQNAIDQKGYYNVIESEINKCLCVSFIPTDVALYSWLKPLLSLDEDINIAITATVKSEKSIIDDMDKNIARRKRQLLEAKKESEKQSMQIEIDSSKSVLDEIALKGNKVFDVNITINVKAENEDKLRDKITRVEVALGNIRSIELMRKKFDPFISTLPILSRNKITEKYTWNLTSVDIASILPFDDSEYFREDGIIYGKNPKTGMLYSINSFGKEHYNPHTLIIGISGSGKTFFIQYLTERKQPNVDFIIKLDVAGVLSTPDSKTYVITPNGNMVINPFFIRNILDTKADKDEIQNPVTDKILDLLGFFKNIGKFDEYEVAILENCLKATYMKCGMEDEEIKNNYKEPTFTDFNEVVNIRKKMLSKDFDGKSLESFAIKKEFETLEKIEALSKPYVSGVYSKLFNGKNKFEYEPNTVLDFSKLNEIIKKPVYYLILKDLWRFCIKDGSNEKFANVPKKLIVIDEEHEFIDQPQTLEFIAKKVIKQGRKYEVESINATQNITDLHKDENGYAILSNCNFKFLFSLAETDHKIAQEYYSLTEKEMNMVRGSKLASTTGNEEKGKGILMIGGLHLPFKAEASIEEIKIIAPSLYKEIMGE